MDWTKYPKVELHLHLDCSLSYQVVSRIDPSITFDQYQNNFIAPTQSSLEEYLKRAPSSYPLMQTEENLRLVVLDLFEQLQEDNMLYAEIRFAPLLHLEAGLSPRQVVACVEEATAQAVRSTGIEARLILCTLRFYSKEQSMETVQLVEDFQGSFVAGFDIAADKPGDVFNDHLPAFKYARDKGLPFTAHAGETRGADNVWSTILHFLPSRLGHGVPCLERPELVELIQNHRIHLEVCPTSNIQTNTFRTYAEHHIEQLYREGVSVGVNTDARTISHITLSEEYAKLQAAFGWHENDFLKCNQNALKAAFIPTDVRNRLERRLVEGYQTSP